DLAELDQVFRGAWLWSSRRWNLYYFKRADYLGPTELPLDEAVRRRVAAEIGRRPEGPIRLLTTLRSWGIGFNPVSFYYCFDAEGEELVAVLAEITNTPWGERHTYVLTPDAEAAGLPHHLRARFAKDFHVSPFHPMEQEYQWTLGVPGQYLGIAMRNLEGSQRVFDASLTLRRVELTPANLRRSALRHPVQPLVALLLIYLHALILWLKRVPFHPHPAKKKRTAPKPP
ncbi:MAG: DUF1365 domain-containing protein, partial [Planctomycetes bacterium]|nr:DUF1365 domain-containing protein [Planctomycetota bacterium]